MEATPMRPITRACIISRARPPGSTPSAATKDPAACTARYGSHISTTPNNFDPHLSLGGRLVAVPGGRT